MSKLRWVVLSAMLIGVLIVCTGSALMAAPATGGASVSAVHQSAMVAVRDADDVRRGDRDDRWRGDRDDRWRDHPYRYWNPEFPDWGYGPGHPWNGPQWGSQCDWRWLNGGWVCVPFNGYSWPGYNGWWLGRGGEHEEEEHERGIR